MLTKKLRQGRNQALIIFPYIQNIKNKRTFLASIFLGKIPKKIEFKGGGTINIKSFDFDLLISLLAAITYSTSYKIHDGKIEFCYDTKNKFSINIEKLTREDRTLLELFFYAQGFGANFVTDNDINNFRDKTFRLSTANGKKIIETSTGIKFYLDLIAARRNNNWNFLFLIIVTEVKTTTKKITNSTVLNNINLQFPLIPFQLNPD